MKNDELSRELDAAKNGMLQVKESIEQMKCEYDRMASDLHDCVNELCYQCGQYRREHDGACEGCRWLKLRRGW